LAVIDVDRERLDVHVLVGRGFEAGEVSWFGEAGVFVDGMGFWGVVGLELRLKGCCHCVGKLC